MVINSKKIKEVLAKGILLLGITGTLTLSDGVATIGNPQVVYAATTVQSKKESALKSLEKVYKTYYKKYYTEKEYNKLTKIYNKGIKALNSCKTKTEISDTLKIYKEKLLEVKPSIFVKYQQKMEKNLLTYYNNLLKNNSYSTDGLVKLEETKNATVENIYNKKTKTKAKKAKANGIKELDSVITLSMEKRDYAIMIINYSDLSKEEKETKINEINNLYENNSIDDALEIITPYEKKSNEKIEEENAVITVDQIENKIKELCKKYPKYTKEEIRALVATANMDYVNEEDIYTIFNAKTKKDVENKVDQVYELIVEITYAIDKKGLSVYNNKKYDDCLIWHELPVEYDDIIWFDDLFINNKLKKHMTLWANEIKNMAIDIAPKSDKAAWTTGAMASCNMSHWFYGVDTEYAGNLEKNKESIISIDDSKLAGGAGYISLLYMMRSQRYLGDYRSNSYCNVPGNYFSVDFYQYFMEKYYDGTHFLPDKFSKDKIK